MIDQSRNRVLGILNLGTADAREIVAWTAHVLSLAGERRVSLLVARDYTHVIAVDPDLAAELDSADQLAGYNQEPI